MTSAAALAIPAAVPVVETEQFAAESDREGLHIDAAPAPDQEMAELVHEHDEGEHEQERQQIAQQKARRVPDRSDDIHKTLRVSATK